MTGICPIYRFRLPDKPNRVGQLTKMNFFGFFQKRVLTGWRKSIDCVFCSVGVERSHFRRTPEKDLILDILKKKLQKLKFCS